MSCMSEAAEQIKRANDSSRFLPNSEKAEADAITAVASALLAIAEQIGVAARSYSRR